MDNCFERIIKNPKDIWCLYKLGLYKSVLSQKKKFKTLKGITAEIIANSVVGDIKYSQKLLKKYEIFLRFKPYNKIYYELLPFFREKLLNFKINDFLKMVIYAEIGDKKAQDLIKKCFNFKNIRNNPELLLLYSNIFQESNKQALLNKYLKLYGLWPLKFRNDNFSFYNLDSNLKTYKMDNGELISIVMTTYNSENFIENTLNSLFKQTYQNIEIIIVDDNSSDNTVKKIKRLMQFTDKIKLIELNQNVGTYVAKNIGIQNSKGKIITFHDSDDISHPQKIELQYKALKRNNNVSSISYWIRMDEYGIYKAFKIYPFLRMNLSSLMLKLEVIEKLGFFDSVRTGADNEFFHRIERFYGKDKIVKIKKPLSIGLYRENSLMTSKDTGFFDKKSLNDRIDYWENWNYWHMSCFSKKKIPYIPYNMNERFFSAPKNLISNYNIKNLIKEIYESK